MQVKEVIILAGGLGTRLRSVVSEVPKCMAPVAGRPFLFYVINYWRSQGMEKFIFSLGYKHEVITGYLQAHFSTLSYQVLVEDEPLGTGGAIYQACKIATEKNVLVTNGDTLFKINIPHLSAFHFTHENICSLALKPMEDFDRYGVVAINDSGTVTAFKEKKHYREGLINGGVYILQRELFIKNEFPEKFSFEKDFLEREYPSGTIKGLVQDGYFIDIGIPEDYQRVQDELAVPPLDLAKIDKSWTLFLDRDGVINHERQMEYVLHWGEFHFYDRVTEAINTFAQLFGRIIIITNQRGVGRQLMTEDALLDIHLQMEKAIREAGGSIDKIYYCTSTENQHTSRKPNPGMAFQAKADYPDIDFSRSIMAGNKLSDMQFGRNAGMYTVYIATTNPEQVFPHPDIDLRFPSLHAFATAL